VGSEIDRFRCCERAVFLGTKGFQGRKTLVVLNEYNLAELYSFVSEWELVCGNIIWGLNHSEDKLGGST